MASILRSVRRGFAGLHTGRKPAEVDPLSKKIDDGDARKELVTGYTKRLIRQRKSSKLLADALFYMVLASAVGAYELGRSFGKNQFQAKNCQASGKEKAQQVDDLS